MCYHNAHAESCAAESANLTAFKRQTEVWLESGGTCSWVIIHRSVARFQGSHPMRSSRALRSWFSTSGASTFVSSPHAVHSRGRILWHSGHPGHLVIDTCLHGMAGGVVIQDGSHARHRSTLALSAINIDIHASHLGCLG